ncbi:MAG: hypothetical protein JSU04_18015 [Bdellovibrionales bacterium]|nr:hypothetical protein [Bdellovibrionales bacterium]
MKTLLSILTIFVSLNCFAKGSGSGTSGDSYYRANKTWNTDVLTEKFPGQVYYMGKKQAEIEFATNNGGDDKVEIRSLRPEEIADSGLIDGLKRSQQSKKWENVNLPVKIDMNRTILNKMGGMQVR